MAFSQSGFRFVSSAAKKMTARRVPTMLLALAAILCVVGSIPSYADCVQEQLHRGMLAFVPENALKAEEIHYRVLGKGKPETIVLVHGLSGRMETWNRVAEELAQDYQVIIYDQRGHGKTVARGENYSSSTMAGDLNSLLDHLAVSKVHLVGHSMGGRTVVRFANLFPDRVASVTVEDMHMMGRRTLLPDNLELSRRLKASIPDEFSTREEAVKAFQRNLSEESAADMAFGLRQEADGKWRARYRLHSVVLYETQGLQEDLTSALQSVQHPMLFIAAESQETGAVLFGKGIDHLKANKPNALLRRVPEAGHGVHGEKTYSAFMKLLRSFVSGHAVPVLTPGD